MPRRLTWATDAWEDYCEWEEKSRPTTKRINRLIRDALRDPFNGFGDPEPLKHSMTGLWSRRIDSEHRLVYAVDDDSITVFSCKTHYKK